MRSVLVLVVALGLTACGRVVNFDDAGAGADDQLDGGAKDDAAPDALSCADMACGEADDCCPDGCNGNNDPDCDASCGNGVLEAGETCDPVGTCPTSCPAIGCALRTLDHPGTCQAACVGAGDQTTCQSGDGCCPDGCTLGNDAECAATCDNGLLESGEQCDPLSSCPQSCPQNGCNLYTLFNDDTCQAQCVMTGTQGACSGGDGCCPGGCNANNDSDCDPVCGNNVIEPGETCEGAGCACAAETYTCFTTTGSAATCDLVCHVPQQKCGVTDSCCPYVEGNPEECDSASDNECRGSRWREREWYQPISYGACTGPGTTFRIYSVAGGDSMLLTTCSPGGGGIGDPIIRSVRDDLGNVYNVGNDDCGEPGAIPNLAGWSCRNDAGSWLNSCASPDSGGFIVRPGAFYLEVNICGFGSSEGRVPFWIWWNGQGNPNPG